MMGAKYDSALDKGRMLNAVARWERIVARSQRECLGMTSVHKLFKTLNAHQT